VGLNFCVFNYSKIRFEKNVIRLPCRGIIMNHLSQNSTRPSSWCISVASLIRKTNNSHNKG